MPGVTAGTTVTVTATRNGVTVSCTFTASSTVSSCDLGTLADGDWSVIATTADVAGNSVTSAPLTVTVDTAAPRAPAAPELIPGSDTGSSSTDNETSDDTPGFTVPGVSNGSTVTVTGTNGDEKVTCTYVASPKTSSCNLPPVSDGTWEVTSKVTDTAGNTSGRSKSTKVTVTGGDDSAEPDSTVPHDITGLTTIVEGGSKVGGMSKDGWVRVEKSATQYVITTSDGLKIAISAKKTVDSSVKFNSRGMPVFYRGDEFRIEGEGLKPRSPATTWLFSDPVFLGRMTVADDGSFSDSYPMGDGVPVGDHTAQLNAIAPDGTLRVVEVAVEIIAEPVIDTVRDADNGDAAPPAPVAPPADPAQQIALIGAALALAAITRKKSRPAIAVQRTGGRGASADMVVLGRGDREPEVEPPTDEDSGSTAEIAGVGAGFGDRMEVDGEDLLRMPRLRRVDLGIKRLAETLDRRSPMFARILNDGAYVRSLLGALWLILPVTGAVLGVIGAADTSNVVMTPALGLMVAVMVIGCIDSLAGLVFTLAYLSAQVLAGGIDSVQATRGAMGIVIVSFAPVLIASAVRPFRRPSGEDDIAWNRVVDFVLTALFGAWTAGTMYSALPTLTGFAPAHSDRVDFVQGAVLLAVVARWLLENATPLLAPRRFAENFVEEFDEPTDGQKLVSDVVRTGVFAFVAASFIGVNWALWAGSAMFLVPKIIDRQSDRFPNVPALHRYVPRNLVRVVVMLFLAVWWGGLVESRYGDNGDFILWAFVLMSVPGLALGGIDWFGRDSRGWRSTAMSRVLGVAVLIVGILVVRGVIL